MLESGEVKNHVAGEVLFREGDAAAAVLLVVAGKLEIYLERQGRRIMVNHVASGAIVGELAVLCGLPRSASVRAAEDSAVLHWTTEVFRHLLLTDGLLSERVFRQSLSLLIKREQELMKELLQGQPDAGRDARTMT